MFDPGSAVTSAPPPRTTPFPSTTLFRSPRRGHPSLHCPCPASIRTKSTQQAMAEGLGATSLGGTTRCDGWARNGLALNSCYLLILYTVGRVTCRVFGQQSRVPCSILASF